MIVHAEGRFPSLVKHIVVVWHPSLVQTVATTGWKSLYKCWWQSLDGSMKEAAEEEKRLVIERGSYHEGIVDAGWSKRSHEHSYNANAVKSLLYPTFKRNIATEWGNHKELETLGAYLPLKQQK